MGLPERDPAFAHLRGTRDDEEGVAILFDLGPLMSVVSILDGEFVQAELALDAAEQFIRGFEKTDPDDVPLALVPVCRLLDAAEFHDLAPAGIYTRGDDPFLVGGSSIARARGEICSFMLIP